VTPKQPTRARRRRHEFRSFALRLQPQLRYPFKKWQWFTVNSTVSWRDTYYSRSRDPVSGKVVDDDVNRRFFSLQSQLVGPVVSRIWNTPDNGYAEKFSTRSNGPRHHPHIGGGQFRSDRAARRHGWNRGRAHLRELRSQQPDLRQASDHGRRILVGTRDRQRRALADVPTRTRAPPSTTLVLHDVHPVPSRVTIRRSP